MNILHISEPNSGGVFSFITQLVSDTPEYRHTVIVGDRGDQLENEEADMLAQKAQMMSWKNSSSSIHPVKDIKSLMFLYRTIKAAPPDTIIHLHSTKAALLGRFASFVAGRRKKTVYTTHASPLIMNTRSDLAVALFRWFERISNWMIAQTVTCSESESRALLDANIPNIAILNGTILADASPRALGQPPTIGFIGRAEDQKDPHLFARIAARMLAKYPSWSFIWIGDGQYADVLRDAGVTVTGWITQQEVSQHLQSLDIYLSSSAWEGLPLSGISALSLGCPLIVRNRVGTVDLVNNNLNGMIFETEDEACQAIEHLLEDEESYTAASQQSLEHARSFDIVHTVDNYKKLYIRFQK